MPRLEHRNFIVVEQNLSQSELRRSAIPALSRGIGRIRVRIGNLIVVKIVIIVIVVLGVALGFFVSVAFAVELFFFLFFLFFFAVFGACACAACGWEAEVRGFGARVPVSAAFQDFEAFRSDAHVAELNVGAKGDYVDYLKC
jgi:hypothetical protein